MPGELLGVRNLPPSSAPHELQDNGGVNCEDNQAPSDGLGDLFQKSNPMPGQDTVAGKVKGPGGDVTGFNIFLMDMT